MSSSSTEILHSVNDNLRAGLARLLPEPNPSAPLNAEALSSLQLELVRGGACLRGIPPNALREADLEQEISEYRRTVEQLAQILPSIRGRLLTEKARLEIVRAHVAATEAWAQTSRETL